MRPVSRRHVLYIPGFDPVPPRAYRERYRREAARQAELSGFTIENAEPAPGVRFGWNVDAQIEGRTVSAALEVLYWADIVRDGMKGGVGSTYMALLRTAWVYIGSGALFRLMQLRKGPVIAALYPMAVLLVQALLAAVIWAATSGAVILALDTVVAGLSGRAWAMGVWADERFWFAALVPGPMMAWVFLRWCAKRDQLYAWYLIKDYAFSSSLYGAYPSEQEARMTEFALRIEEVLQSDVDEVLVVGHSSGAYIAASVLADLIRAGRLLDEGPTLSLLTLGHVVPMVSFLPDAGRLRADLALMGAADVAWVDVSAPGDGCAFALCDPVAVSGVATEGKSWPLVISAAFTQTLSKAEQSRLRWRPFELHFQYLNAFDALPDVEDAYDYFRVTAGPMTLGDRFSGRAPSQSRIERPVNKYTDMAA